MNWANRQEYPTANELPAEIRSLPISDDLAHNFNTRAVRSGLPEMPWDESFGTFMMPLSVCRNCKQRMMIGDGMSEKVVIQFWMAVDEVCPAVTYVLGCCNTGTWPQNRRPMCPCCRTEDNRKQQHCIQGAPSVFGAFISSLARFPTDKKVIFLVELAQFCDYQVKNGAAWVAQITPHRHLLCPAYAQANNHCQGAASTARPRCKAGDFLCTGSLWTISR